MKKLAWVLLAFATLYADVALAKDDSCKERIKGNTEYAQWGFQLRAEMLNKCGRKPSKSCERTYMNKITEIDKKNTDLLNKAFPNAKENDPAFVEAVGRNLDLYMSAKSGLQGLFGSASGVADFKYRMCKGLPLLDPEPRRSSRPMPPMPPPMMPMEPSISSRLSPMQPETISGPASEGCTNYSLIGPNGGAQYCQNCCYGGTCNVICY